MKKNAPPPPSLTTGTNALRTGTNALRAPVTAVRAEDLADLTRKVSGRAPAKKAAKKSKRK